MRNYKRKTITEYSKDDWKVTVDHYNNKTMKMNEIFIKYKLLKTTILNNVEPLRKKRKKPFISYGVAQKLVKGLINLANWGFG